MTYQIYLLEPLPPDVPAACQELADAFGLDVAEVEQLIARAPGAITRALPLTEAEDTLDFVLAAGFTAELREAAPAVSQTALWEAELAPPQAPPVLLRGAARRAVLVPFILTMLGVVLLYMLTLVPQQLQAYQHDLTRTATVFANGVSAVASGLPLTAPAIQSEIRAFVNAWEQDDADPYAVALVLVDGSRAYIGGFNHTAVTDAELVRHRAQERGRQFATLSERFAANGLVLRALRGDAPLVFGSATVPQSGGAEVLIVGNSEQVLRPLGLGALVLLAVMLFGLLVAAVNAAVLAAKTERR